MELYEKNVLYFLFSIIIPDDHLLGLSQLDQETKVNQTRILLLSMEIVIRQLLNFEEKFHRTQIWQMGDHLHQMGLMVDYY